MAAVANGSDSRSPELVFVLLLVAGLAAQQKDRLAGPIDAWPVLASSRPPGLNRNRIGARSIRLSRSNQMTIAFKLSDSRQADLQRLLANQQDRSSPTITTGSRQANTRTGSALARRMWRLLGGHEFFHLRFGAGIRPRGGSGKLAVSGGSCVAKHPRSAKRRYAQCRS